MADSFCPKCGTEVDEDARFCPTCGQTLAIDEPEALEDAASEPLPAAPAWPPPEPAQPPEAPGPGEAPEPAVDGPEPEPQLERGPEPVPQQVAATAPAPDPRAATPPPPPPAPGTPPTTSAPDMPFTWPTTLSGWLIGAGSAFAALSLLPRLGNPLDLLLFVALLAISASIFLADRIPRIERQRLIVLVVLVLGLGVALERAAFAFRGVHTIFLIAMILAAGGAMLIELDRDRPVPPIGGAS